VTSEELWFARETEDFLFFKEKERHFSLDAYQQVLKPFTGAELTRHL
jgi:hypothetical protein